MSDRIAVMSSGRVLQIGSPTEIYERPNCKFVADFIGETNFLAGTVEDPNPAETVVRTLEGLMLRGQSPHPVRAGVPVVVSVRPEKARLTVQEPTNGAAGAFLVTVERVAYIGSDTRILVRLGGDQTLSIWEQNTRSTLDRDAYWQPGEQGYLWWPVENALVLTE